MFFKYEKQSKTAEKAKIKKNDEKQKKLKMKK